MNLQFVGILASIQNIWPDWRIIKYLAFLNLNLNIHIPQVPRVDVRMQFIILAYFLPLIITNMLLLSFKPIKAVLWYFSLLCSAALMTIGTLFYVLPKKQNKDNKGTGLTLIQIGGVACTVLILMYAFEKWRADNNRRERLRVAPEGEMDEDDVSEFNLKWLKSKKYGISKTFAIQSRNSIIAFSLLYVGGVSANIFTFSFVETYFYSYSSLIADIRQIPEIFGLILFILGIIFFYNWISNQTKLGIEFNTKVNNVIKKDFVKITLIVLGLLYIPTTTSLFSMTLCEPVECAPGKELVTKMSTTADNVNSIWFQFRDDVAIKDVCVNCPFNKECPIDLQASLCPSVTDSRLSKDLTISCVDEIYPFYFPGIFICVISVTFGIPYLYYKLITVSTKFVKEIPTFVSDVEDQWMIQAKASKNSCKSLYSAFERRFRYYKLFMIMHRLLVVITFVFASTDKTSVGITFGITCIHGVALVINAYSRPFFSRTEDFLCLSCVGVNTVNGVITICLALGIYVSELTIYIVGFLNIALPVLFVIAGVLLQNRNKIKMFNAMREEKTQLLKLKGEEDKRHPREFRDEPNTEFVAVDKIVLQTLDVTLDKKLLKILVNFFLVMGITTFIGLCLAVFDVTYNSNSDNSIIDIPGAERTVDTFPFGVYTSWNQFTSNCCCMPDRGINGTNYKTEVWKCRKSQSSSEKYSFKSFVREYDGLNGYLIRDYCSPSFNNIVCGEPSLTDQSIYPVLCPNATGLSKSSNIVKQLW